MKIINYIKSFSQIVLISLIIFAFLMGAMSFFANKKISQANKPKNAEASHRATRTKYAANANIATNRKINNITNSSQKDSKSQDEKNPEFSEKNIIISNLKKYFKLIKSDDFKENNKGLLEVLRRRIEDNYSYIKDIDENRIQDIISFLKRENQTQLWKAWFALKISAQYPELVQDLIETEDNDVLRILAKHTFSKPHWQDHPELVKALIEKKTSNFSMLASKKNDDVLRALAQYTLPHLKDHPEFVQALIDTKKLTVLWSLARYTLPHFKDYPELIEDLAEKGNGIVLQALDEYTLPHFRNNPRLIELSGGKEVTVANLRKKESTCF